MRVTLIIYILGINTLATLVQATENADEASTEVFKDAWFQPHTTPQENTIEVLGHYPINMESVQFSKNRLNPDMVHGGLFKFMGAS